MNNDHRAKLLTAVQLLHDIDMTSDGEVAGSSSENDETRFNQINKKHGSSPFGRRHFPRDSGCYEGSPVPITNQSNPAGAADETVNSLDDVVAQCSNEILKRVESARRKEEKAAAAAAGSTASVPLKGVQRVAKKGLLGGGIGDDTLSRGALSEKSDSGVSSSSLSSGPLKNSS